jgi:broad specificity phosphatase PhoE
MRIPGGESLQELVARAADSFRLVARQHPRGTVVMVSHESVNRALLLQLLDQPLSAFHTIAQDPCAINEICLMSDRAAVMKVNQTAHLETR